MDKPWRRWLPPACAVLGGVLLAWAGLACAGLRLGGWRDRLEVWLTLVLLAGLRMRSL